MKLRAFLLSIVVVAGTALPAQAVTPLICLAYDTGGIGDQSFNDAASLGLKKATSQYLFTVSANVTDGTSDNRILRLTKLTGKGCKVIIAIGDGYADAIKSVASDYPFERFAIINSRRAGEVNVSNIAFEENQGAFLAGVTAAYATKTGRVAMVTTPDSIDQYENGFLLGVKSVKRSVRSFIKFATGDPTITTRALVNTRVDIIYFGAEGSAHKFFEVVVKNNGSKSKKNDVGVILADPDQYVTTTSTTSKYVLATVNKRVDLAIGKIIGKALNGSQYLDSIDEENSIFGHIFSINDDGVEIAIRSKALATYTDAINSAARGAYGN